MAAQGADDVIPFFIVVNTVEFVFSVGKYISGQYALDDFKFDIHAQQAVQKVVIAYLIFLVKTVDEFYRVAGNHNPCNFNSQQRRYADPDDAVFFHPEGNVKTIFIAMNVAFNLCLCTQPFALKAVLMDEVLKLIGCTLNQLFVFTDNNGFFCFAGKTTTQKDKDNKTHSQQTERLLLKQFIHRASYRQFFYRADRSISSRFCFFPLLKGFVGLVSL
jgi:hypothetical protein